MEIRYEFDTFLMNMSCEIQNKSFKKRRIYNQEKNKLLLEKLKESEKNIFFLDEQRFKYYSFEYFGRYDEKFTIKDLKEFVSQKYSQIRDEY